VAVVVVWCIATPAASLVSQGAEGAPTPWPTPLAAVNVTSFNGTQYLIVTAGPYGSIMQEIADWKTQKGLPARVALIEDIQSSYAGRDDAEKLHNFLQDVHFNATGGKLKYVLLGGGAAVIPIRYLHTEGNVITWYTHDDVFSDVYFAGLNSNWDHDGDMVFGEYGEEDWDANVFVGRLPFNSTAEARIAKDNLLSYEKAPQVGAWMRSAVAFASVFDPPNNDADPFDPTYYDGSEDNGLRSIQNTLPFIPAGMNVDVLADYYELTPGNYSPDNDRLDNESMVGAISAGASVVMSVTHGWVPSGKGTPEYHGFDGRVYAWGQGLTYLNATSFTNFGELSFGYFSSCLVGNFSNPSLPNFGRFVLQDNHGFVAEIVPTDGTLRGEDDYINLGIREGNWWQSENFWKNFFTGSDPYRPGPALYQGIRDYAQHIRDVGRTEAWGGYRTQKAVYNLLGDPEVPIWTDVALSLDATLPTTLYTAEQHFRATLHDNFGRPVAGATVALSGAGVYTVTATDSQGRIDVLIHPRTPGGVTVTATQHNKVPLQVVVPVVTAPADLSVEPDFVFLPSPVLRTDERVDVAFTVRNLGQQASGATDARVYVTAPGQLPQLLAGSIPVAALGPGEGATATFSWTPATDGVHVVRIVVDPADTVAEFDELNNEVDVAVPVSSVDLSIDRAAVALDPGGQVAPGSLLRVAGTVNHEGVVPRGYLVGYEVLRGDGSAVLSGNVQASTSLTKFSFSFVLGQTGDFTLRITADAEGSIVEFNETNNVVQVPLRSGAGPTIYSIPPLLLDEDAGRVAAVADLAVFVTDPDTPFDRLLFSVGASSPELAVWVDGHQLVAMPSPDWSGNGTVQLAVTDGAYASTTAIAFAVRAAPDPPRVAAPAVVQAIVGDPVVVQLDAHDPDNDALSFASLSPGVPMGASTGRSAFVALASMVGTTTLHFTVSDGRFTVPVAVALIVFPEDAPPTLIDLGPLAVVAGHPGVWTLAAHDPEGEPVVFATTSNQVAVLADGTIVISASMSRALGPGTYRVPVSMSDGLHLSAGEAVILVTPAPAPSGASTYGTEPVTLVTAVSAVAAAAAGLAFTLSRRRESRPD
jgi:hypothetical protein